VKIPVNFLVAVTVLGLVCGMVVWASGEPGWFIMPIWAVAVVVATIIENRRK